jgi:hypothetical protein
VSSLSFVKWCGMAALVATLAYTALLLLMFLQFYLEFLQPFRLDPSLERWTAVVLLSGVLAALLGLFPLLRERRGPMALVPLGMAVAGATLLLAGAFADALYGPAYLSAGRVLLVGLVLAAVGLLPLGIWLLFAGGLPRWAAAAILVGAPPFAIYLFPLLGPAWAVVGYALLREGSRSR